MAEENKKPTKKVKDIGIFGTGKRKGAVARIRIHVAKGDIIVNDKPINEYFASGIAKVAYLRPFSVLDLDPTHYSVSVKVAGGGKSGQLDAVASGIAKALLDINPEYRSKLKKASLLTRDSRVKERRKFGLAGKARADKQRPKR